MKRDVVFGSVRSVNHERVSVSDLQGWSGVLAIDRNDLVGLAQPLHRRFLDLLQSNSNESVSPSTRK